MYIELVRSKPTTSIWVCKRNITKAQRKRRQQEYTLYTIKNVVAITFCRRREHIRSNLRTFVILIVLNYKKARQSMRHVKWRGVQRERLRTKRTIVGAYAKGVKKIVNSCMRRITDKFCLQKGCKQIRKTDE